MERKKEEILNILGKNRDTIRSYGVRRLSLFGSCAREQPTEASDIDFVVEFEKKSFDAYMDLKIFLEKLFDCPVDLVIADAIKPRLRGAILGEAVHVPGI
jgi:predicted nucleotidyltransferase